MTFVQDLDTAVYVFPDDPCHRAIGWLSINFSFAKNEPDPALLEKLREYTYFDTIRYRYGDASHWYSLFGVHSCEFCMSFRSSGYVFVPGESVIFVCPRMIYHYVADHYYDPLEEFKSAVLAGPPVESSHYENAIWEICGWSEGEAQFWP